MTGVIGMNPDQVRDLARLLDASSRSLEDMTAAIGTAVRVISWGGRDAEQFRSAWSGRHAPVLRQVGTALHATARTALADADEQESASSLVSVGGGAPSGTPGSGGSGSTSDGSGGSSEDSSDDDSGNPLVNLWNDASDGMSDAADGVTDGLSDAVDTVGDGATQVGDWAEDGLSWGSDQLTDAATFIAGGIAEVPGEFAGSAPDVAEDFTHFGGLFLHGEPPSVTEVVAGSVLLAGSAGNLAYRVATVGQDDPHFLDDGEAEAGRPIPLTVDRPGTSDDGSADGHPPAVVPTSLSEIAASTAAAYEDAEQSGVGDGGVRITTVEGPDGPSYIVSIPGTQSWSPSGSTPADLTGNLEVASGQSSTASEAVRLAMMEAGVPADAPVMLSGHSQGGMIAMELAGDPAFRGQFDVTNVMTFGSPVDIAEVPHGIDIVAFQHQGDAVPLVDLGGRRVDDSLPVRPNGADVITLPNPEGIAWYDPAGNHDFNAYVESIAAAEADGGPANAYGADSSFGQFMTSEPSAVSGVVVPITRSH